MSAPGYNKARKYDQKKDKRPGKKKRQDWKKHNQVAIMLVGKSRNY